jgi:tRNA pseudouridine55 synthase
LSQQTRWLFYPIFVKSPSMRVFGFLNVNKPLGMTSHDVVAQVRRGLKIKKVGHAGTLDPLATGVLVLCLGAATRLSEYVMHTTKQYRAQIHLGVTTTTYDAEGEVLRERDASGLTRADFEQALAQFRGAVQQLPPMHSAVKQGGRKLYQLARAGEVVEREPRAVEIFALEIIDWSPPQVTVDVTCSAGAYIRSMAHDLGEVLGVGAYLSGLTRTASGQFLLSKAIALDELLRDPDWQQYLIPPAQALSPMPVIQCDAAEADALAHGRLIPDATAAAGALSQAYNAAGDLVAIVEGDGQHWRPHKVFV